MWLEEYDGNGWQSAYSAIGTLLSFRRYNRERAITVEFLLMDSTIALELPRALENVMCQPQKIPKS